EFTVDSHGLDATVRYCEARSVCERPSRVTLRVSTHAIEPKRETTGRAGEFHLTDGIAVGCARSCGAHSHGEGFRNLSSACESSVNKMALTSRILVGVAREGELLAMEGEYSHRLFP